jgi:hypothetical protein
MQNSLLAIDHQGVPSIVTTLKAHDGTNVACQQIDDLTLTLITPLNTQNDNVPSHKIVGPVYRSLAPSKIQ